VERMSLELAQERYKSTGRNDACPCGSEKKYKKCHHSEDSAMVSAELTRLADKGKADAEAKAAEEAEQEESEGKKGTGKAGAKKTGAAAAGRNGNAGGKGGSRSGQTKATQSLPRRGAV
jgi:SEC-C motif